MTPPRSAETHDRWTPWLLAALIAASLFDLFRLGFFADDFIFLDAVRRQPWLEVALGQHGIWPWYRPLSREGLFALAHAAGHAGPAVGHLLSLAALWAAAVALFRVAARRLGTRAAAIGAVLFVGHALTRFLTGWLSGFQDVLALALVLSALRLHDERRLALAACCIAAAPFAKETGFLALPLLALDAALTERRRLERRELAWYAGGGAVAVAIHVLVRLTWPAHPAAPAAVGELRGIAVALWNALVPWTTPPGPATAVAWASAALAAAIAFVIARCASAAPTVASPSGAVFVGAAVAASAAPAILPALFLPYPLQAHFFFPALPWGAALAGYALVRVVARPAWLGAIVALATGALVWTGSARRVDLDAPGGWATAPLGWSEAQRIEARTRRLEGDARALLAARPESLVVGYLHLPSGSWFQTQDGPATRWALDDPTVRTYLVGDPMLARLAAARRPLTVLDYDPVQRHALVAIEPGDPRLLPEAVMAMLGGREDAAETLAGYSYRGAPSWFARYVAAAAALVRTGDAPAFSRVLGPATQSAAIEGPPMGDLRVDRALRGVRATPGEPRAHVEAADSLAAEGLPLLEALELTVAVRLDSTRAGDALRLGRLLAPRLPDQARRALTLAGRAGAPAAVADAARTELAQLP